VTALAPVHTPLEQVSILVHRLPSLHVVPSFFAGLEHLPVAGAQVPIEWHWSLARQVTGLAPTQLPL
jgi:hypothetical protein